MDKAVDDGLVALGRESGYGCPSNKTVVDCDGHTMRIATVDGRNANPFGENHYRKVRKLELKDDDIILCGYPKTGCHWTWEILSMIVRKKAEPSKIGKGVAFLEMAGEKVINSVPSPRILNTHATWENMPEQTTMKNTKLVLTVRNPKDTVVSYYNHTINLKFMYGYEGSFHGYFGLFMEGNVPDGSYFDYYKNWDKVICDNPNLQILVVNYDDMQEDLQREVARMCKFLEISLDDQTVQDIMKVSGFQNMKNFYNESGCTSSFLMRKGQSGDWKNWLTVEQSELIDAAMEKHLANTRFAKQRYVI